MKLLFKLLDEQKRNFTLNQDFNYLRLAHKKLFLQMEHYKNRCQVLWLENMTLGTENLQLKKEIELLKRLQRAKTKEAIRPVCKVPDLRIVR